MGESSDYALFTSDRVMTFSRASTAYDTDLQNGVNAHVSDVPRFGQRLVTNYATNPRGDMPAGSMIGENKQPISWSQNVPASSSGIRIDYMGSGVEDGIAYVDLRHWGTALQTTSRLNLHATTTVVEGETWTSSVYAKHVAGSLQSIMQLRMVSPDEAGITFAPTTAPLSTQRYIRTRTIGAGITTTRLELRVPHAIGEAVDMTIRYGGVQLEMGSTAYELATPPDGVQAVSYRFNSAKTGLLIESASTNLLRNSQGLTAGGWSYPATTDINSAYAPDGTLTADQVTLNSATLEALYQSLPCTPSTQYTFSYYVKLGTLAASDFFYAIRDDTGGAFIAVDQVPTTLPTSTGWTRVVHTFTTPVGCVTVRPYMYRRQPLTTGTAWFWGAQLEPNHYASAYMPSSDPADGSRAIESARYIGGDFVSLFGVGAPQGWLIADVAVNAWPPSGSFAYPFEIDDGTINNVIRAYVHSSGVVTLVSAPSGAFVDTSPTSMTIGVIHRIGMMWGNGRIALCMNAGSVRSVATAIPAFNSLYIGNRPDNARPLNGRIARVYTGRTAPTDAQFQAACQAGADVAANIPQS